LHILFLTDNFPPEVNAPASRTYEHCREWVIKGAVVTVITCAPNFPNGKVFKGYRNYPWQSEVVNGIRVIRVWSYIAANKGFTWRILDYISFMISAIIASLLVNKVDLVIGTSPQFFTVCAAFIVGRLKAVPWVFELRDMWPASIKAVGALKNSIVIRLLEKLEIFLYKQATIIITVTHTFRLILIKMGVEDKKISVITNGVDLTNFYPRNKNTELINNLGLNNKFIVGYVGTHGMAHGLGTILDTALIIQKNTQLHDIIFLFIGSGAQKYSLVSEAKSKNLQNILFLDTVSKSEVGDYWALLDISIIHLRNSKLFESVLPSKLFECMGMGIPVLLGVPGESADIVLTEKMGCIFESENSIQLADLIIQLKTKPKVIEFFDLNAILLILIKKN
jgi:glycosyltransferase involved in cell wall biosynthesis